MIGLNMSVRSGSLRKAGLLCEPEPLEARMEFRIADTITDSLAKLTGDEQKAVKTAALISR
jgi:hypothetical protein